MSRKRRMVLWLSLSAFGLYVLTTGGLAVFDVRDFGGQSDIRLAVGLQSDVWLVPKSTRFDVPLMFHYYRADAPFALRLQIWDERKEYQAIEITDVIVQYKDGEVVRKADSWSRQLRSYTQSFSSSGEAYQTHMFMLSDQIEDLVLRHADNSITLKGTLVRVNGEKVPFQTSEQFEAESRFGIAPYWRVAP